jgi:hypothetical protein
MTEQFSMTLQKIYYQRTIVKFMYPQPIRKGKCVACLRTVKDQEIKTTQMHHTKYAYETNTVIKNPLLALENTLELCFGCHPVADGFRDMLLANPRGGLRSANRVIQIAEMLPPEQRDHFTLIARLWLKKRNER